MNYTITCRDEQKSIIFNYENVIKLIKLINV